MWKERARSGGTQGSNSVTWQVSARAHCAASGSHRSPKVGRDRLFLKVTVQVLSVFLSNRISHLPSTLFLSSNDCCLWPPARLGKAKLCHYCIHQSPFFVSFSSCVATFINYSFLFSATGSVLFQDQLEGHISQHNHNSCNKRKVYFHSIPKKIWFGVSALEWHLLFLSHNHSTLAGVLTHLAHPIHGLVSSHNSYPGILTSQTMTLVEKGSLLIEWFKLRSLGLPSDTVTGVFVRRGNGEMGR